MAALRIYELPSARGCTYIVPAQHFALALTLGIVSSEASMQVARKIGVSDDEVGKLCEAVKKALRTGPQTPDEMRLVLGGEVRNLGPEGAKKGVTTTLPLALANLQASGEIRRVPLNGRLDQQRYRYSLWEPNPIARKLPLEEAYVELARLYFRWIGPATLAEFQWFSGLGVKAAKAALEPLGLRPVVDHPERLLHPEDTEAFYKFQIPETPDYRLVGGMDGICLLRRDVRGLLAARDLARHTIDSDGNQNASGGLTDLPMNAIMDRGRLVGFWEFDPVAKELVFSSFVGKPAKLLDAVRATEAFIQEDLGDARSFSLDSPTSRVPRIEFLREENARA